MKNVVIVIGPGQIGQAIARRIGVGKHVLLADMRLENANAAADVMANAGHDVTVAQVDASSRQAVHALVETATGLGEVTGLVRAAAGRRRRHRRRPSSRSTSTAPRSCSRRSATSSPAAASAWSSPRSQDIALRR